ncbi:hypothetical protein FHS24_002493 [Psychrobacter luti]|uniref:Uncharacterized protein n=1 Tax=Psychrobacter luti TaxID=198481 RepID=A0A839TF40_9GAMM|nr:hypothetical protein [Psychrobacter luti]
MSIFLSQQSQEGAFFASLQPSLLCASKGGYRPLDPHKKAKLINWLGFFIELNVLGKIIYLHTKLNTVENDVSGIVEIAKLLT